MLHITIELWPGGDRTHARSIGEMQIWNVGGGDQNVGNYKCRILKSAEYSSKNAGEVWKQGEIDFPNVEEVRGFPRTRLGPFDLLLRALLRLIGDRNLRAVKDSAMGREPTRT